MPPLPQDDEGEGQGDQNIAQGQIDDPLVKRKSQKLAKNDTYHKQLPALHAQDWKTVSSNKGQNQKHDTVDKVPLKRKINTMDDTEKIAAKHAEAQAEIEKMAASQENNKQNKNVKNSEANNDNKEGDEEDAEDGRVENVEENDRDDENDGGDANEQKDYDGDNGYMENKCK